MKPKPNADQREAIDLFLSQPITVVQGPPGTGKSTVIIAMLDEWLLQREAHQNARILITAANYAAMSVVVEKIISSKGIPHLKSLPIQLVNFQTREGIAAFRDHVVFVDKDLQTYRWDSQKFVVSDDVLFPPRCIIVANEFSLGRMQRKKQMDSCVDLIVVDEASQLAPDHFLAPLTYVQPLKIQTKGKELSIETPVQNWTKVLVVGDGDQLSAVRRADAPEKYVDILGSLYSFYSYQLRREKQKPKQLIQNYRSVPTIVEVINLLGIYSERLLSFPALEAEPLWCHRARFFIEEEHFSFKVSS